MVFMMTITKIITMINPSSSDRDYDDHCHDFNEEEKISPMKSKIAIRNIKTGSKRFSQGVGFSYEIH